MPVSSNLLPRLDIALRSSSAVREVMPCRVKQPCQAEHFVCEHLSKVIPPVLDLRGASLGPECCAVADIKGDQRSIILVASDDQLPISCMSRSVKCVGGGNTERLPDFIPRPLVTRSPPVYGQGNGVQVYAV